GATSLEQFQYFLYDMDGSDGATVQLTVVGRNDQTTATNLNPTGTFIEDGGAQAVGTTAIVVADPDTNDEITVTLTLPNTTPGTLAAPGGVFNSGVLTITGTATQVNTALAAITFTPGANYNADFVIAVSIQDGLEDETIALSGSISMTGTAVADAPTFTLPASPDQSQLEDTLAPQSVPGFATNITTGAPDESGQTLFPFVVTNDNNSLFTVQPAIGLDGTLTYTLAPNANGTAIVSVTLSDNGSTANGGENTSPAQTFTIAVTAVNDAPSFALPSSPNLDQTVLEDAAVVQQVAAFATNISAGPIDEVGQTLTFHVTTDNPGLFTTPPAIDPITGNLTYTLAPNAFGIANVTVTLSDTGTTSNGGVDTSAPQTFTISVTGVNDAPSFALISNPNQTVLEDAAPQNVTGFATNIAAGPANESSQILTFHVTNDNNSLFLVQPSIDPLTGNLTYTLAPNANGSATVTVGLSDDGGTSNGGVDTSGSQTFTITATAVNDAPVADDITLSVPENSAAGTVVGTVIASDVDTGDTKTFSITSGNLNGTFTINATTGQITVANNTALDFETNPVFNLVVTVTDGGGLTDTANVTIDLTNVIEPLLLNLPSAPITFYARHGKTVIDAGAGISNPDAPFFVYSGARLSVQVTGNGDSTDRISIYSQSAGPGRITVSGKNVMYGSQLIGTITQQGNGRAAMVVTFNQSATTEAVSALMKVISYKSTSRQPGTAQRTVTFTLQSANSSQQVANTQVVNVSRSAPSRSLVVGSGPTVYQNATAPVPMVPAGTIPGPDYLDFDGARISLNITSGRSTENRVQIGQIGGITTAGEDVFYNGYKIGQARYGNNSLTIKLSSSDATPEAIQALTRAITFSTSVSNSNFENREVSFQITDVTGRKTANVFQTIVVS
ncbi:MAG: Ig-like domain-containing protein, partial [Planctomycetota bacterium]